MPHLPFAHSCFIDGNLNQPGAKRRLPSKLVKPRERFQQYILRYIFGVLFASQHRDQGREDRPLMRPDELKE